MPLVEKNAPEQIRNAAAAFVALSPRRLLVSIRDSVQHVDYAVARELAFQEGVRHAQLTAAAGGRYSWFLSVASAAALASVTTAYLLTRRKAFS